MELNDALRIPLALSDVSAALQDIALLRASLDHCETFERLPNGGYRLMLVVPLGPLRACYEIRAHVASQRANDAMAAQAAVPAQRTLNFKARADGIGSLRGQISIELGADDGAGQPDTEPGTRIDYSVWAMSAGALAELPARQIENALHELADDFFTEFCAVIQAKHGVGPNHARRDNAVGRQHVFLRPIHLGVAVTRHARGRDDMLTGRTAGSLRSAHGMVREEPVPHAMPYWVWAAMIFFAALLLYLVRWLNVS
ncbi:CoxG family protein [Paraburkholderia hayleyella]|uniref:CoxG family protein n=1 Tax=Paraburkholderia hayleyella TaxID=2152889 RepID=UPI001291F25D|nr:SRPBCC domain-containing protein [Paraburkholderia hayleyella]